MLLASKVPLVLLVFFGATSSAETAKRDLIGQPPTIEYLQLGNFGPVSRLSSHPTFAPLALSPQQLSGFMQILLDNGLLNPNSLKLVNGQPLLMNPLQLFGAQPAFGGNFFGSSIQSLDPYFLYLLSNYARFLPYGLGPQGIYGSTGLPKPLPKPLGLFKYNDKN